MNKNERLELLVKRLLTNILADAPEIFILDLISQMKKCVKTDLGLTPQVKIEWR